MKYLGPVHAATLTLHHQIESMVVGQAMKSGNPPMPWFAGWLSMKGELHRVLDDGYLPRCCRKYQSYVEDLSSLPFTVPVPQAMLEFASTLNNESRRAGAAYVLIGGNLMGGEVIRRALGPEYPQKSFLWDDRETAMHFLRQLRHRADAIEPAIECFSALIASCEEIKEWGSKP